jgi:hypothetical protein
MEIEKENWKNIKDLKYEHVDGETNKKFIYQYDMNYKLIKKWKSMNEILDENKSYKIRTLHSNLYNKSRSAYGYRWSRDKDLTKPEKPKCILDETHFIAQDVYEYQEGMEYWKDIIGYEARYKVSTSGRVYSKAHNALFKKSIKAKYYTVKLRDANNKAKMYRINILVAKHFIYNPNNCDIAHHIDHNKLNNNYINLQWTTLSGNRRAYLKMLLESSILQYDSNENIIKRWNNIGEILEENKKYSKKKLLFCLKGNCDEVYEYIWKYENDFIDRETKQILNNFDYTIKDDEEFKTIVPIKGKNYNNYEVSKYGKVRNVRTNEILTVNITSSGYFFVSLIPEGEEEKTIVQRIHRLMAYTFLDKPNDKNYVNHKDENKLNNNLENLEWMTNRENIIYSTGRKVNQIDIKTNKVIDTFNSLSLAAEQFKRKNGAIAINRVCRKIRKTTYGYKWQYAEEPKTIEQLQESIIQYNNEMDQLNNKFQQIISQYNKLITQ